LAGVLQSIIWIAQNDFLASQSAVGLTARQCPQAATPRQAAVANYGRKKKISMSTTVPTAWQIYASLTLQGGSFPGHADGHQHHIESCGVNLAKGLKIPGT
jgi:hypothetical protein